MKFPQLILNAAQATLPVKPVAQHGQLADVLKIRVSLCDEKGNPLPDRDAHEDFDKQVVGIFIDGEIQYESQYQSPFENANPEQRMPTLMGMLQSGEFLSLGASLGLINKSDDPATSFAARMVQKVGDKIGEVLESVKGRSNFTKLNSTQIYVSSSPVKITGSIFFTAWRDARTEVDEQVAKLARWSLSPFLYEHSLAQSFLDQTDKSARGIFPSRVPPFVAVSYGGKSYVPMRLETVSHPLVVPMTEDGSMLAVTVSVTFSSLAAWDASNVNKVYGY